MPAEKAQYIPEFAVFTKLASYIDNKDIAYLEKFGSKGKAQVRPWFLKAMMCVIHIESNFNALATSRTNAKGLCQVLESTRKDIVSRINKNLDPYRDLYQWQYNLLLGANYFAWQLWRYGSFSDAAYTYNQGSKPGKDPRQGAEYQRRFEACMNGEPDNVGALNSGVPTAFIIGAAAAGMYFALRDS